MQISELKDVASLFQKELSKLQDEAESSLKSYVQRRVEDVELMVKNSSERLSLEIAKNAKETFQELE